MKLVAIVGLTGAGKSEVTKMFTDLGYVRIHFGSLTMEKLKEKELEVNEANERTMREDLRKEHGMAAYAILNIPKIEKELKMYNVVIDGLYSWAEYKVLKQKFKNKLKVIAVYASPELRYYRLSKRPVRPLTEEEAKSRDYSEIEYIEKAGPIAMADFTVINESSFENLKFHVDKIIEKI